jgi:hypothetical protein
MCRNSVKWLYRLDKNFSWDSQFISDEDHVFFDDKGKVRLIIQRSGIITVTQGYAWNGCSPKFCLFDFLIGTPEGVVHKDSEKPKTYYASLVHDALYQFLEKELPLDRKQADGAFLRLMKESEFAPATLYWLAVRLFGGLVYQGKKRVRRWSGVSASLDELMAVQYPGEEDLTRAGS